MISFTNTNQPRVEKVVAMIATIRKSAKNNRIGDDALAALLAPILVLVGDTATPEPVAAPARPLGALCKAPHIEQIAGFVAALPREQLPIYITHIVNRLCEAAEISA